jgi:hypothetical protein
MGVGIFRIVSVHPAELRDLYRALRAAGDVGKDGCPLAEEVGSGRFCAAFTGPGWMAMDPDCQRHSWRCLTCGRVQLWAAEPTIVGRLDRWVYADQSDVAADSGHRDGPGDARPWGGRVGALTRR